MRWPWLISTTAHAALLGGIAALGALSLPQRAPDIPTLISLDIRPEPQERFRTSRYVFSEPVTAEPEMQPPDIREEKPDRTREDSVPELPPAQPIIDVPAGEISTELPPDLCPFRPQRTQEPAPPPPIPVGEKSDEPLLVPVPGNPPPRYPESARRRGHQGTVIARLEVSREGRVLRAELVESSGSALLDDEALSALKRWRFSAPGGSMLAASFEVLVPVNFNLRDPE